MAALSGAPALAAPPERAALSPEGARLFRELVYHYEARQWKRGLKCADAILRVAPTHGETLAMKGLICNSMGSARKAEAHELVKLALKHDIRSHVCWHVYGLIHRSDANYAEAIKSYRNALRIEPENQQIMRDLAVLQVHLRDLHGHVETRHRLLPQASAKQVQAPNWLGLAMAHQLAGNANLAVEVLEKFDSLLDPQRPPVPDDSELTLYRVGVLRLAGRPDKALALLRSQWARRAVTDEVGADELEARLLWDQGDFAGAAAGFLGLVMTNPDNHEHHRALRAAFLRCVDTGTEVRAVFTVANASPTGSSLLQVSDRLLALYALLAARFPSCRCLPWMVIEGLPADHPAFRPVAAAYMRAGLRRGIPALFAELSAVWAPGSGTRLWTSGSSRPVASAAMASTGRESLSALAAAAAVAPGKREAVLALAEEFCAACEPRGSAGAGAGAFASLGLPPLAAWPSSSAATVPTLLGACSRSSVEQLCCARGDGEAEVSSTFPFMALLLARCLDASARPREALALLERALAHSPTVLELYLAKAKCLKHLGDLHAAAAAADEARMLDLADRHLNSKAVKYLLREGNVEEAERLIALFARHDVKKPNADPLSSIREVQVLWFELASGLALERRRDFGRALKRFAHIEAIYEQIFEDGFDYHTYCLRRATLRAYSSMMQCAEALKAGRYFQRAAMGAARVFLALSRDRVELERVRAQATAAAAAAAGLVASSKDRAADDPAALTAAAASAAAAAASTAAAATAAAAVGTPEEASAAAAASAAAVAASTAEEDEAVAIAEARDPGIDVDPEGAKLLAAEPLAEAWRHARLAADNLPPQFAVAARTFEAGAQPAFRRSMGLPPSTTADVDARSDGRAPGAADLALDVHVLCAEVALEQGLAGAAASHLARALAISAVADAAAGEPAAAPARERVRAAAALLLRAGGDRATPEDEAGRLLREVCLAAVSVNMP